MKEDKLFQYLACLTMGLAILALLLSIMLNENYSVHTIGFIILAITFAILSKLYKIQPREKEPK